MGTAVNPELGARILREIHLATNQQLQHDKETHPFWKSLNRKAPDEVVIATSSFRKAAFLALQLLLLNGKPMPPFFEEFKDSPLKFLKTLKSAFHNGNNESKGRFYLGELYGVPVMAESTEGEKHGADEDQMSEAWNKASWVAAKNAGEDSGNVLYVGIDTLDSTRIELPNGETVFLPPLPKPSSWPDFPKDYQTNPESYEEFKRTAIEEKFAHGAILRGMTAAVLINSELDELAVGFSSVETVIDRIRLMQMIGELDHNASGFGALQLLIDWDEQSGLKEHSHMVEQHFPNLSVEQQKIAAFFLLAQIMGAPALLIIQLIRESGNMSEKRRKKVSRKFRQALGVPTPDAVGLSAGV